jgi:hypothetical protein
MVACPTALCETAHHGRSAWLEQTHSPHVWEVKEKEEDTGVLPFYRPFKSIPTRDLKTSHQAPPLKLLPLSYSTKSFTHRPFTDILDPKP